MESKDWFSKRLIGSRSRLKVWGKLAQFAIEPPEPFYVSQIVDETGLPPSNVYKEVKILEAVGLVETTDESPVGIELDVRTKRYVRKDSKIWDPLEVLLIAIDQRFSEGPK